MAEDPLIVKISLSKIADKKGKDKGGKNYALADVLTEIKRKVCALLNTNGGKLVLKASDATTNNKINADKVIRPVEQYFKGIIGEYEVHKRFYILEEKYNTITLEIQALPILCSFNTNFYLPTDKEIQHIVSNKNDLRDIMFKPRLAKKFEYKSIKPFFFGRDCGFHESKTVQFKFHETKKTRMTDFADRVINNEKFMKIISAFANAAGGNIFYGINDDGIVEGEKLSDSELCKTTEKLEKAVGKMIWQEESREVERGKEWEIKFVPVKDCNNETIPSTFVIVVTVNPYIGGVFTKEPESYYLKDGVVMRMSFDSWRRNTYYKVSKSMQEMKRETWSTEENRIRYMKITQKLENLRQVGSWKQIEEIGDEINRREKLPVNTKLTCLVQIVALHYRQGDFAEAEKLLENICKDKDNAEDKSVFVVKERYSASAIERSQGNYHEAWKIIKKCIELARHAPAGFIPAAVYANAASILSSLVDEESLKNSKELVEMAKSYCHHALQHLCYIEDKFKNAREDLKQRIYITLASLCVKLADPELSLSPDDEIKTAEQYLIKPLETQQLTYNTCRKMLVKSDMYFQMCKLESKKIRIEHLEKSLKYVQEVEEIANKNTFREINMLCGQRWKKLLDFKNDLRKEEAQTKPTEQDDQGQTKEIVDELLS